MNSTVVVCNSLVRRFGGVDRFSREWHAHIMAAGEDTSGSKRVLDSILAVIRLMEVASKSQEPRDVTYFTGEELEAETAALVHAQVAAFLRSDAFDTLVRDVMGRMSDEAQAELMAAIDAVT